MKSYATGTTLIRHLGARDFQDGYNDLHSLVLWWNIILGWADFTPNSCPFATLVRWLSKTREASGIYFTGWKKVQLRGSKELELVSPQRPLENISNNFKAALKTLMFASIGKFKL